MIQSLNWGGDKNVKTLERLAEIQVGGFCKLLTLSGEQSGIYDKTYKIKDRNHSFFIF